VESSRCKASRTAFAQRSLRMLSICIRSSLRGSLMDVLLNATARGCCRRTSTRNGAI
jgi:hypothetical protein